MKLKITFKEPIWLKNILQFAKAKVLPHHTVHN